MTSPSRGPNGANLAQIAGTDPVGDTRGWIRNLATEEVMAFWFRPSPVRESIRANYGEMAVLGMSHGYQTYEYTSNVEISFDLYVNRLMLLKRTSQTLDEQNRALDPEKRTRSGFPEGTLSNLRAMSDWIEDGRRFLESLQYPPAMVTGDVGASPPPCLLVLPGICTLRIRVQNLLITHIDSDNEGNTKEFQARMTFTEAPMGRITMEDVRENGMFRVWGEF